VIVLVVASALLLLAAALGSGASGGIAWDLLNGAGFSACALYVHLSWVSASPARQPGLDMHSALAIWICVFATIHGVGLLLLDPTLLEYLEPDAPAYMHAGVAGLLVLILLTAMSFPGPRQRVWRSWPAFRSWHRWLWVALLGGVAWHVIGAGFYLDTDAARMLGGAALVLLPLAFWVDRRMPRVPARDHRPGRAFSPATALAAGLAGLAFAALRS
jgi:hypothetical protein